MLSVERRAYINTTKFSFFICSLLHALIRSNKCTTIFIIHFIRNILRKMFRALLRHLQCDVVITTIKWYKRG